MFVFSAEYIYPQETPHILVYVPLDCPLAEHKPSLQVCTKRSPLISAAEKKKKLKITQHSN